MTFHSKNDMWQMFSIIVQYSTYMKDIDLDVHIKIFKNVIKANGKTMEANIINLFGFTLGDNTSKWGENFV